MRSPLSICDNIVIECYSLLVILSQTVEVFLKLQPKPLYEARQITFKSAAEDSIDARLAKSDHSRIINTLGSARDYLFNVFFKN